MRQMCIAQKNVLYFKKIPLSFCVVRIAGSKHYIHKSGLIVSHIISTRMFLNKKVRKARLLVFWLQKTTKESLQFFLSIFKQESINSCQLRGISARLKVFVLFLHSQQVSVLQRDYQPLRVLIANDRITKTWQF